MDALDRIAALGNTEPVEVDLAGKTLRVKPPTKWKSSALSAIRQGDFETWASTSLVNDEAITDGQVTGSNDYAVWQSIDPDVEQIAVFFNTYRSQSGGLGLGE